MQTTNTTIFIEISVAVAGDEVMVHSVKYNCHAWDDGDSDPQTQDSGFYANRCPQQVHPEWVTTSMLYHCDAAAEIDFIHFCQTGKTKAA